MTKLSTLREAAPKIYAAEGLNGFYKSLVPLWGRQIPYTMMKFACFERTVEALYAYVVPKPRAECSKGEQLIVTFAAGYIAGGTYFEKNSELFLKTDLDIKNVVMQNTPPIFDRKIHTIDMLLFLFFLGPIQKFCLKVA